MKRKIILIFQRISLILGLLILALFFVPMMFGIMPYIVMSGSMEPEIKTGSVAYINSKVKAEEIKIGDIIGFTTKEGQVTHRVVEINSDGSFVTKGDNNEENDSNPVQADKVKGKTIFSIPVLGRLAGFVKSKQGIIFVCVYIFLNALCIIFDNKIYNDEIPSTFKEAIMKCESLDEIKKVIIDEMDSFKEQILEDVSSASLKQLEAPEQKLLPEGNIFCSEIESLNIENIDKLNLESEKIENKSEEVESIERDFEKDNQEESEDEEVKNILNEIDLFDEEEIDLDKVKQELIKYDNPKLRELRDKLKENFENSKIISIDTAKEFTNEIKKEENKVIEEKSNKTEKKDKKKKTSTKKAGKTSKSTKSSRKKKIS